MVGIVLDTVADKKKQRRIGHWQFIHLFFSITHTNFSSRWKYSKYRKEFNQNINLYITWLKSFKLDLHELRLKYYNRGLAVNDWKKFSPTSHPSGIRHEIPQCHSIRSWIQCTTPMLNTLAVHRNEYIFTFNNSTNIALQVHS